MLKKFVYNLLYKKKYYYVPPCPHCNSSKTGFIINNHDTIKFNIEKEKVLHLLNGEIVEIHSYTNDENTLFCLDCGLNWFGIPEIKYLTRDEIENEKNRRGIDEEFIYQRNLTKQNLKLLKKEQKRKAKAQKKSNKKVKVKTNKKEAVKIKK